MRKLWRSLTCVLALAVWGSVWAQESQAFDIFEFQVEGATLLPVSAVEAAVYPYLGEKKTLQDVEAARLSLEKSYHTAGYLTVLVSIPQQKVEDAVVRLAVTEAAVERLRIVESRYYSPGEIRAAVPSLAEGKVTNFADMQEELAALNRSADRRVSPVLRPGKTPGTVEVDLKVQDELPLHGSVELNDRYSEGTTPTRAAANLRWDNLWGRQHSLGVTLQTVPENPRESNAVSMNYTWPQRNGDILALYAVRSESDVTAVGSLSVVGKGDIWGARYIMPLPAGDSFFHTATLGVDYKDFKQSVTVIGSGGFNTPIHYMPLTMGWDGNWLNEGSNTKLGVSFNFHLQGMAGTEQEFADKRYKGKPGYSYLKGNASHKLGIGGDWAVSARANVQIANQALVSNEQFGIGGVDSVRGYYESAATGETGISTSLELISPNWAPAANEDIKDLRSYFFVDQGSVTVIDPLTANGQFNLGGVGFGLRVLGSQGLTASLDWAVALNEIGKTKQGDSRLYFRLAYEW